MLLLLLLLLLLLVPPVVTAHIRYASRCADPATQCFVGAVAHTEGGCLCGRDATRVQAEAAEDNPKAKSKPKEEKVKAEEPAKEENQAKAEEEPKPKASRRALCPAVQSG